MNRALLILVVLALAACGGSDDAATTTESATEPVATTTAPTATAALATTTTAAATTTPEAPTTTEASTTAVDPSTDIIERFINHFAAQDFAEALALVVPGSGVAVYLGSTQLLVDEISAPDGVIMGGDGTYRIRWGDQLITFSDFVIEGGLIADMSREGATLSTTVAASGATYEAQGITGTVHSFRYFDGDLQVVVTTVNNSDDEGYLGFIDYVTGGRQFSNVFSYSVRPTVTSTYMVTFEDVPSGAGTLYGNVIYGNISELDVVIDVPALGAE